MAHSGAFFRPLISKDARKTRYPWRVLAVGEGFLVPWGELEKGRRTRALRRHHLGVQAWRMGRWGLHFSLESREGGVWISRVEKMASVLRNRPGTKRRC